MSLLYFLGYSPLLTGKLDFVIEIEIYIRMFFSPIFEGSLNPATAQ